VKFSSKVTIFRGKLVDIKAASEIQQKSTKGYTEDKAAKKKVMCYKAFEIAHIAVAYAVDTNDPDLRELIDFPLYKLSHAGSTIARDRCQLIYDTALPIKDDLVDFGYAATMLPALDAAIKAYEAVIAMPRKVIVDRKVSGMNINQLMDEANEILLKQLDNMIVPFMTSMPDFYNKYVNARIIIDLGHGSKEPVSMISGMTIDFETDQPVGLVHVWLEDGSSEVYSDTTGKYALPVYKAGAVYIYAEKPGYKRSQEDWIVAKGIDYELNIDLEADVTPGDEDDGIVPEG
jgi:hypothetical protein